MYLLVADLNARVKASQYVLVSGECKDLADWVEAGAEARQLIEKRKVPHVTILCAHFYE